MKLRPKITIADHFSTLELPQGIPSHDTFARVFSLVNPEQLQQCFHALDRNN